MHRRLLDVETDLLPGETLAQYHHRVRPAPVRRSWWRRARDHHRRTRRTVKR
jgi:hypothetical protein